MRTPAPGSAAGPAARRRAPPRGWQCRPPSGAGARRRRARPPRRRSGAGRRTRRAPSSRPSGASARSRRSRSAHRRGCPSATGGTTRPAGRSRAHRGARLPARTGLAACPPRARRRRRTEPRTAAAAAGRRMRRCRPPLSRGGGTVARAGHVRGTRNGARQPPGAGGDTGACGTEPVQGYRVPDDPSITPARAEVPTSGRKWRPFGGVSRRRVPGLGRVSGVDQWGRRPRGPWRGQDGAPCPGVSAPGARRATPVSSVGSAPSAFRPPRARPAVPWRSRRAAASGAAAVPRRRRAHRRAPGRYRPGAPP
ncbi:hypothetical protein SNARM312S_03352 [Streptomyces narbonensis]